MHAGSGRVRRGVCGSACARSGLTACLFVRLLGWIHSSAAKCTQQIAWLLHGSLDTHPTHTCVVSTGAWQTTTRPTRTRWPPASTEPSQPAGRPSPTWSSCALLLCIFVLVWRQRGGGEEREEDSCWWQAGPVGGGAAAVATAPCSHRHHLPATTCLPGI